MSTLRHEQFIDRLQAVIRAGGSDDEPTQLLARIGGCTRRAVMADAAGFGFIGADGRYLTVGETDRLVITVDAMQDQLREGPGIDLTTGVPCGVIESSDLLADRRWPRWAPLAAHLGFRALLSLIVSAAGTDRPSTFTVYSRQVRHFTPKDLATIRLLTADAVVCDVGRG